MLDFDHRWIWKTPNLSIIYMYVESLELIMVWMKWTSFSGRKVWMFEYHPIAKKTSSCSMSSHYFTQWWPVSLMHFALLGLGMLTRWCWLINNWTLGHKLHWNLYKNKYEKNPHKKINWIVICKITVFFSWPQCFDCFCASYSLWYTQYPGYGPVIARVSSRRQTG